MSLNKTYIHALQKNIKIVLILACVVAISCNGKPNKKMNFTTKTAKQILGNPDYLAISYGGYRGATRERQPSLEELKEDLRILHALGIRILRTYNLQLPHSPNILKAIKEIQERDADFEMYVMLGAWIDCKNAWTQQQPNHNLENTENNSSEIEKAITLANQYPDIVKIIAVGNEAMVHWATSYFVSPAIILKWVSYLQKQKKAGNLPGSLWITSSDNFASWGGGGQEYHNKDLEKLVAAVDYISMHTYPFHDTHYNPNFWKVPPQESSGTEIEIIEKAMQRALEYATNQYESVKKYVASLGEKKPIHIGETGWATTSWGLYGPNGSNAADQYKQALYYKLMRQWSAKNNITCFFFEAFDEQWKDPTHANGSENHFGLFTIDGQAKYALWPLVDNGIFKGLTRNQNPIKKTFNGDLDLLITEVFTPKPAIPHSQN